MSEQKVPRKRAASSMVIGPENRQEGAFRNLTDAEKAKRLGRLREIHDQLQINRYDFSKKLEAAEMFTEDDLDKLCSLLAPINALAATGVEGASIGYRLSIGIADLFDHLLRVQEKEDK